MRERDDTEPHEVVSAHRRGDELDGAAGQPEVEHPQRIAAAPVEDEADRLAEHAGVGPAAPAGGERQPHAHRSTPLRHAYARPRTRTPTNRPISATAAAPRPANTTAHGNRNTASTAKSTNRNA